MKKQKSAYSDEDNLLLFSARNKKNIPAMGPRSDVDRIIDYSKASSTQNFKKKLNSFFENQRTDFILKTINGILSLFLVVEYIYSTYQKVDDYNSSSDVVTFLVHVYLLIEYLARLYSAKDFKKYLFSLESRIDIASNIPNPDRATCLRTSLRQ